LDSSFQLSRKSYHSHSNGLPPGVFWREKKKLFKSETFMVAAKLFFAQILSRKFCQNNSAERKVFGGNRGVGSSRESDGYQGCQIFLATTYQNGKNVPNNQKMYQITRKCTKWP
jgi:hypothetical protein